ncbi:MAG: hypothetical protein PUB51_02535 [Oscillospiraceae bacterium]|nr:hypothetical protein [Oscillospiraceae bacterium]
MNPTVLALSAEAGTRGLTDILSDAGEVVTSVVGWVPKVANLVMDTPILLIGFSISLGLLAIKVFQRLRG